MIERDGDLYLVHCDRCSEVDLHIIAYGWQPMIGNLKNNGWCIRLRGGEWEHICPACREEEEEDD